MNDNTPSHTDGTRNALHGSTAAHLPNALPIRVSQNRLESDSSMTNFSFLSEPEMYNKNNNNKRLDNDDNNGQNTSQNTS